MMKMGGSCALTFRTTGMVHLLEQQLVTGRRNAAYNTWEGTGQEAQRTGFLAFSVTSHYLAEASSWF